MALSSKKRKEIFMFSKLLNQTRKKRGFTAQQMANQLHIGIRNYRKYESGDAKPTLAGACEIAKILNVPLDYLLCNGVYGAINQYPWVKQQLAEIMDNYLIEHQMTNNSMQSTLELDDVLFGQLATAFFAEVNIDEKNKTSIIVPRFSLAAKISDSD